MLRLIIFLCLVGTCTELQSQSSQKSLGQAYADWSYVDDIGISNDGHYIFYIVNNHPAGKSSIIVTDANNTIKKEFLFAGKSMFSEDSRRLYFSDDKNNLNIVNLADFHTQTITGVLTFELVLDDQDEWLVYRKSDNSFCFVDGAGQKHSISEVNNYWIPRNASVVFATRKTPDQLFELISVDLKIGMVASIEKGLDFSAPVLNRQHNKCTFWKKDTLFFNDRIKKRSAILLSAAQFTSAGFVPDIESMGFDSSGTKILFTVQAERKDTASTNPTIWNYSSSALPSEANGDPQSALVVYDLKNAMLSMIKYDDEILLTDLKTYPSNIFFRRKGGTQAFYKKEQLPGITFSDLNILNRRFIVQEPGIGSIDLCYFSPDQRYVVWFSASDLCWYAFDVFNRRKISISERVSVPLYDEQAVKILRRGAWAIAGWMQNPAAVLLYDSYDIWKVPLKGGQSHCITNGVGRKEGLIFNVVTPEINWINNQQKLVVSGYDITTKRGGYFFVSPEATLVYDSSRLQPYSLSSRMPVGKYRSAESKIIKAKYANKYVVLRETADNPRNVYVSSDLKNFILLSSVFPEKHYQSLSAALHSYRLPDGKIAQGILYTPKKLDSSKRYPVIFNYYEKRSDELYKFFTPASSTANINIPAFVAEGYLVFVLDIYCEPGHNGEGVYHSIESAASYVSTLPFVDSLRFGLQGHSFGGWQTNYMITRSKRFKAACEASGVADQVSAYGQLSFGSGTARHEFYELLSQGSPYGLGVTPWTGPDKYIQNSPVFGISSVSTPLLMMHNREDAAVPFEQALEFFLALRRAGRQVWLIQYGKNGHELRGDEAEDYHNRMLSFFNQYLKNESHNN